MGSTSTFYQFSVLPENRPEPTTTQHPILSIQHLLLKYDHLFQTPSQLPPPRQVVHRITLALSTALSLPAFPKERNQETGF